MTAPRLFALLLATALGLALGGACQKNEQGYAELPSQATPNARLREGAHSQVMARYFTLESALTSRLWGSAAGTWAYNALRFTFDDELNNVTPPGPELLFLPGDGGAVRQLPPPPGVLPQDLLAWQHEATGFLHLEEEDLNANGRTARFVTATATDGELLVIRHATDAGERLLRLAPGAAAWSEERLSPELRGVRLHEVGRRLALLELPDGGAAVVRDGQLTPLDSPPASLAVPAATPLWFGPFDGASIRAFWAEPPGLVCAGTWNLETGAARRDGCLDLVVGGARVVRAAGSVDETVATVLDSEPFGVQRLLHVVAAPGRFELKGVGGYGAPDAGTLVAWPGTNPVASESECDLTASSSRLSRHFDADGGFGLARCPTTFLGDACECSRSEDQKGCDCLQRSVNPQVRFRAGRYDFLQAGWETVDGRLLLRVHRAVTDTSVSASTDPFDALLPFPGPFSWSRATAVRGFAPGYGLAASDRANLGACATVTGPAGEVPRNADLTFTVDLRDEHTLSLSGCQPPDQGPPLEPLVARAAALTDGGREQWELLGLGFARGAPVALPDQVTIAVSPAGPLMVTTSHDGTRRLLAWDAGADVVTVDALPAGTGAVRFVPDFDLALDADGKVLDLAARSLLGTLPAGRLAPDRQAWLGADGVVWRLGAGTAVTPLGATFLPAAPLAASPGGLVVAATTMEVSVIDALDRARRAVLFSGYTGALTEAAISRDGRFVALLRKNDAQPGWVRFYRRDDAQPTLTYVESTLCTGCGQLLGFAPTTGDVLHLDQQTAGVFVYRPSTGASTPLSSVFPEAFATRLPNDVFGRVWFKAGNTLTAWDPATGLTTSATVAAPAGSAAAQPQLHVVDGLFTGVTFGQRVYSVTAAGLGVALEPTADPAQWVYPLAGGRGFRADARGLWVGARSADGRDLAAPFHAATASAGAQGPRLHDAPALANLPCVLVSVGPAPAWVLTPRARWTCSR